MFLKLLFYPNPLRTILYLIRFLVSKKKRLYFNLIRILGFLPHKLNYYELAAIHKSATTLDAKGTPLNNERLEYLGDAILGAIVAEYLFKVFPDSDEGFLTQMRSKMVNGAKLSELARKSKISKLVKSHTQHSKIVKNLYGDAFEAFVGAIYLDRGYYFAKYFVLHKVFRRYVDLTALQLIETNYKSKLIEWGQKFKKEISFYTDLEALNSKYFISFARIDEQTFGSGIGRSKKEAEQKAAKETLLKVETNI